MVRIKQQSLSWTSAGPKQKLSQDKKAIQRLKHVYVVATGITNSSNNMRTIWMKNLDALEQSLLTMREELFGKTENRRISVTGQMLLESAAERATRITKELQEAHKALHITISRVGKSLEKNFEQMSLPHFNVHCELTFSPKGMITGFGLIHDYTMYSGLNSVGSSLKKKTKLDEVFNVTEPDTLQKIVVDLRDGDYSSSLEYLEKRRPPEEKAIRRAFQSQIITDCINAGEENYEDAIGQLKKNKSPYDDKDRTSLLMGALLLGKRAKKDSRYKSLFELSHKDEISKKMTAFFVPYEAPLKNLMKYGYKNIYKITDLGNFGYTPCSIPAAELPIGTHVYVNHSAFACPILKEQCTFTNPPMRLICGHVISRDAISRLTTSRSNRTMPRHTRHMRYKCPYCPREQYMDHAKQVVFQKWRTVYCTKEQMEFYQFMD